MPEIELRSIHKRYPRARGSDYLTVLDGLNLQITTGETVAIVGPSGCGKSTLLNILALVDPPSSGSVLIDGIVRGCADIGNVSLGYLFQRDALLPWRSAYQNGLLGVQCQGKVTDVARRRLEDYFDRFGLVGFEHALPKMMSGGQRQRVALIQSLMTEPEIFLLDEPFGSLDFLTKLQLESELLGVVRRANGSAPEKTVVLVTHDIEEAIVMADRVLVMGPAPNGIVLEVRIPLAETERDPVRSRQSEAIKTVFGEIWEALQGESVPL